jgi:hypothetical protein
MGTEAAAISSTRFVIGVDGVGGGVGIGGQQDRVPLGLVGDAMPGT